MSPLVHVFLDALEEADPSGMYSTDEGWVALDVYISHQQLDNVLRIVRHSWLGNDGGAA